MRTPQEIREYLRSIADNYPEAAISPRHIGALTGRLNEHLGSNENRRKAMAWVFADDGRAELHRADMTLPQWKAIEDWCALREEDGHWYPGVDFLVECVVLSSYLREIGKL